MVSHDFIGLLILGLFNVSIGRQQIRADLNYDVLASFLNLPFLVNLQSNESLCLHIWLFQKLAILETLAYAKFCW